MHGQAAAALPMLQRLDLSGSSLHTLPEVCRALCSCLPVLKWLACRCGVR
jgi:hypothetical protein